MAVKPGGAWWILGMGAIATYGDSPKFPNADPIALGSLLLTPGGRFVSLSWSPASPRPGVPPAVAYSVELVNTGEVINTSDTFFVWEGLEIDTFYTFRVRSLTELGIASDYQEGTVRTLNINEITSDTGEVTEFEVTAEMVAYNPNVYTLGDTWRAHTWNSGGKQTINISTSAHPWYVLIAGSGGRGGPDIGNGGGGGGSFIGLIPPEYLPEGEMDITVGSNIASEIIINGVNLKANVGGSGGGGTTGSPGGGGSTTGSLPELTARVGGRGGTSIAGGGAAGFHSMISGVDLGYCGGGGAGGRNREEDWYGPLGPGGPGQDGGGGGGAGGNGNNQRGEAGGPGVRGGGGGGAGIYNNGISSSSGIIILSYKIEK